MKILSAAISDKGRVRAENQDNLYCNGVLRSNIDDNTTFTCKNKAVGCGLYAVADGMGGEADGAVASLMAVEDLGRLFLPCRQDDLLHHVMSCNDRVCRRIYENNGISMGTTFAGVSIDGNKANIINIGDSRIYMIRDGEISRLSVVHTMIQLLLDAGTITPEEAKEHPSRHALSQNIGIPKSEMLIEPYSATIDISENDIFIICSDGLTDVLSDDEILSAVNCCNSVDEIPGALFDKAIYLGTKDNVTVLAIKVMPGGEASRSEMSPLSLIMGFVTVAAIIAMIAAVIIIIRDSGGETDNLPENSVLSGDTAVEDTSVPTQNNDEALQP